MERGGHVELGRRVRHVRHLQSSSHGRVPPMPSGEQAGGLCRGLGRMQSFLPQLLHVALGEAEQPLPTLPAGLGCPADWQMTIMQVDPPTLGSSFAAHITS